MNTKDTRLTKDKTGHCVRRDTPRSRATTAGDTFAGNAVHSGSPRSTAAAFPLERSSAGHHFEEHAHPRAQMSLRSSAA